MRLQWGRISTEVDQSDAYSAAPMSNNEVDCDERRWLAMRRKRLDMAAAAEAHSGTASQSSVGDRAAARVADGVQPLDDVSALCLSGGGIRSAAFALGIIQGLAKRDLLQKFDYLSTVSGGGYIGSFLTAWVQRAGYEQVVDQLKGGSGAAAEDSPLTHLRRYSRYLTPSAGVISTDMLTVVSIYARNLILNWIMFLPFLVLALILLKVLLCAAIWSEGNVNWRLNSILAIAAVTFLGLSQLDSVLQRPGWGVEFDPRYRQAGAPARTAVGIDTPAA